MICPDKSLVGALEHNFYFSISYMGSSVPTDEVIFFRGIGIPGVGIPGVGNCPILGILDIT